MPTTQLPIQDIINSGLWLTLKLIYLSAFLVYTTFTVIVIRQIKLMSATILGPSAKWLRVASFFYLAISVFCLILAVIIL